jgi:hypothetical protein
MDDHMNGFLIELRGGRSDGERFTVPNLPFRWRVPESHEPGGFTEPPSTEPLTSATDYDRTGRVTDDGAHIYEVVAP